MSSSIQISGIPSKKARKTDHVEPDHISSLPDCVVSHILSLLSTKDAVKTSVLSKCWQYKWTSIYNVELDDQKARGNKSKIATFVKFVERTLVLLQNLQSFRLYCSTKYDSDLIQTWISAALSRDVHILHISYYIVDLVLWPRNLLSCCNGVGLVLPHNLLSCYSLRELVVGSSCTLKVPAAICLPHLTTLRLKKVKILHEVSNSDPMKFNFPVLKTFELIHCKWSNVEFVEIYAPKMTSFTSETELISTGVNDYSINITADSLVKFNGDGGSVENIILSGSSTIDYATLEYNIALRSLEMGGLQIRKLLKGFSSLKYLWLWGDVGEAIARSKLALPKYYRMERLLLYSTGSSEVLLEFLHAAPLLKFLVINMIDCARDYNNDAMEYHVPSCVVSHLEEVTFSWFDVMMNQFQLVKFFLKNAVKLKSLTVHCQEWVTEKEIDEIEEELSIYPRASASLTINVDWYEEI